MMTKTPPRIKVKRQIYYVALISNSVPIVWKTTIDYHAPTQITSAYTHSSKTNIKGSVNMATN